MAITISLRRINTNSNYLKYLYERELTKHSTINETSTINFSFTDIDQQFIKPVRGDYITIGTPTYPKFFTGFIITEGDYEYLGNSGGNNLKYGFKYKASSDEYVLSLQPIGIVTPFLNVSQGAILKSLVSTITAGTSNIFDVTGIQDGQLVAAYLPEPDKTFADVVKEFAESANYRFYANDFKLYYKPVDAAPGALLIDGQGKHFTPARLEITTGSDPVVNDITIFGGIEPQNYVTEYFVSDGFTAEFPLISDVYGIESSIYIEETFSGNDFDSSKWTEVGDPFNFYLQCISGLLQVLGGNGAYNDVYLQSRNPVPLEGNLRLTHGEFDFTDEGTAVIASLWTSSPSGNGTTFSGCVYGLHVSPDGAGNVKLNPIVNGVLDDAQSCICNTGGGVNGKFYTIRTLISVDELSRKLKEWTYIRHNGTRGSYGGEQIPATLDYETIINELNRSTGELIQQFKFRHKAVGLDSNTVYALYTPIVSNDGHLTISNITVSTPLQAELSVFKAGKQDNSINYVQNDPNSQYGWKSRRHRYRRTDGSPIEFNITELFDGNGDGVDEKELVWEKKLIGPNELDTFDGFTPIATIITNNSGRIERGNIFGTPKYNSGNARLVFFKDSIKQTTDIPAAGDLIRVKYRRAGVAVGRSRNLTSIANEAAIFGDSGIRSSVRKDLNPLPRTSEECELAAAALVQDFGYQHYEGTYTQFSTSTEFSGLPEVGTIVRFQSLPSILPQFQAELILEVDSTIESDSQEIFLHKVKFGKSDKVKKLLSSFAKPKGFLAPQDSTEVPVPFDVTATTTGPTANDFVWNVPTLGYNETTTYTSLNFLTPVKDFYLYSWTSNPRADGVSLFNYFNFKIGDSLGSGEVFEVRYTDSGWGNASSSNLVGFSSSPSVQSTRNKRGKVLFVKRKNISSGKLSRYAATVRAELPDIPPPVSGITAKGGSLTHPVFKAELPKDVNGDFKLNTSIFGILSTSMVELPVTGWFTNSRLTTITQNPYTPVGVDNPGQYKITSTSDGYQYPANEIFLPGVPAGQGVEYGGFINFETDIIMQSGFSIFFTWIRAAGVKSSDGLYIRLNIKDNLLPSDLTDFPSAAAFGFYSKHDFLLTGDWQPLYTISQIPKYVDTSNSATLNYNLVIHNINSSDVTLKFCLPFLGVEFYQHADILLGSSKDNPGLSFTYENIGD